MVDPEAAVGHGGESHAELHSLVGMSARILVVDDEDLLLRAFARVLRDEPFEVISCSNPANAIALVHDLSVDIVVTDYAMPRLNGLSVLDEVRARSPATRRVLMSALLDRPEIVAALQTGLIEHTLEKPWRMAEMRALFHELASSCVRETERVLWLVDDDAAIRAALSDILGEEGFAVECFEHGALAWTRLTAAPPPHLILLDLLMPVMDGFAFLERVKCEPTLRHLPIVIMTAQSGLRSLGRAEAVLRKPMRTQDLLTTISAAMHTQASP